VPRNRGATVDASGHNEFETSSGDGYRFEVIVPAIEAESNAARGGRRCCVAMAPALRFSVPPADDRHVIDFAGPPRRLNSGPPERLVAGALKSR